MTADEQSGSPGRYDGPSPYDNRTDIERLLARLGSRSPGRRPALPDADDPSRPEPGPFTWTRSMRRRIEHVARNAIAVADSDELCSADVDVFRLRGGRFVPRSAVDHRGATGFVVLVERGTPAIVFLCPDEFPVRATLWGVAVLLANRVRAALGDVARPTTGPPIDDPRWRGIGVAAIDGTVHVRLHTNEFDRTVALEPDDARRFAVILDVVSGVATR
ncbi:MAG: hypothetical protein RIB98_15045 [Acidimicrobiales bacterium]